MASSRNTNCIVPTESDTSNAKGSVTMNAANDPGAVAIIRRPCWRMALKVNAMSWVPASLLATGLPFGD
ncbi:hypothetical protein D3C72_2498440 [compost metagenome]